MCIRAVALGLREQPIAPSSVSFEQMKRITEHTLSTLETRCRILKNQDGTSKVENVPFLWCTGRSSAKLIFLKK